MAYTTDRATRLATLLACCWLTTACADDDAQPMVLSDGGGTLLPDAALQSDASSWFDAEAAVDAGAVDAADAAVDAAPPMVDFEAFDEAVEAFIATNKLKGASAVVVHRDHGVLHERGYGEFAKERIYLVASCSKIVSVGVLMRLADQGLVDFDQPMSKYLSAWGNFKNDITLAQAFSNSSGMVGLTENPLYLPYICQYSISLGSLSDCGKAIYTATDTADRRKPDTEFHYGGGQWQLAGSVAEVVSKKSWAELIDETYTKGCGTSVLGYTNQFQDATAGSLGLGAVSYPAFFKGDPATLPKTTNPSIEGGMYVTTSDYAKLLLMHLRDGKCDDQQVLSKAAVERMREDRIAKAYNGSTGGKALAGYGMGWWVDREQPGVVVDPGAYGAVAYLDVGRGYGAFIAVEDGSGDALYQATRPALDAQFPR